MVNVLKEHTAIWSAKKVNFYPLSACKGRITGNLENIFKYVNKTFFRPYALKEKTQSDSAGAQKRGPFIIYRLSIRDP